MLKKRFVIVAVAALAATSCAQQGAPAQPAPGDGVRVEGMEALPFEVPEGALFVARTRSSTNIYRIREACRPLHAMNPSRVKFFWTLEAGLNAGYRLSDEEGCR
jgi:hypothetical protein